MKIGRDKYWDIMKGIGIICVVLGHSFKSTGLIAYVYLFHLPLFFFVSGYLYNEERYGDDLPRLIGQRIVGVMPRFMLYAALFVLLHNPLTGCGAMAGQIYDHTHMLWDFCNYAVFTFTDSIAGALWFIPAWMIALFIFGAIVSAVRYFLLGRAYKSPAVSKRDPASAAAKPSPESVSVSAKSSPQSVSVSAKPSPESVSVSAEPSPEAASETAKLSFGSEGVKIGIIAAASVIVSAVGVFLMTRDMKINMHFEVALAMVVIVLLGYLLHTLLPQFRRYTKWYVGIICAVLLFLIQRKGGVLMDLAGNCIEPQWFLITSVLGIMLCLVLSEYIEKVPVVRDVLAVLGRESFDIMALHFTIFKLIDIVYVTIHPEFADSLMAFPVSFASQLWWVYLILGLAVPTFIGLGLDRVKKAVVGKKVQK